MATKAKTPARPSTNGASKPAAQPQERVWTENDILARAQNYRQSIMELRAQRDELEAQLEQVNAVLARAEGGFEAFRNMLNPQQAEQVPPVDEEATES